MPVLSWYLFDEFLYDLPWFSGMESFDNAVSFWEDAMDLRVVQDIEEDGNSDETSRVSLNVNIVKIHSILSKFVNFHIVLNTWWRTKGRTKNQFCGKSKREVCNRLVVKKTTLIILFLWIISLLNEATVIRFWQIFLLFLHQESSKTELTYSLEKLLTSVYHLQEECEGVALSMPNLAFTSSEMRSIADEISTLREQRERDEDASSTDSFVSATEVRILLIAFVLWMRR